MMRSSAWYLMMGGGVEIASARAGLLMAVTIGTGCSSKDVLGGAECSSAEQGLFLACLSAECSAEYRQTLGAIDACELSGDGSVVRVSAGAECGFTSTGSCFVVCDCPDGEGVTFDITGESPEDYEGDEAGECTDGADNDRDGLFDCDDEGCRNGPDCDAVDSAADTATGDAGDGGDEGADDTSGETIVDADGDSFSVDDGDCHDGNPAINPSASDVEGDSVDQNCDGVDGTDYDRDGYASTSSGGTDCDDADPLINPAFGVVDLVDVVDSNCDGFDGVHQDYAAVFIDSVSPLDVHDFDGDGLGDLLARSSAGIPLIFFGSTVMAAPGGRLSVSDADVRIQLATLAQYSVRDIDGDGRSDLAFNHDGHGFIFLGSTIASGGDLTPGVHEDYSVVSSLASDPVGSVQLVGDATGDGVADVFATSASHMRIYSHGQLASGANDARIAAVGYSATYLYPFQLGGLDADRDGLPDFLSMCFQGGRYEADGYRDVADTHSDACGGFLRRYRVGMVLHDIDSDGYNELSDGSCVQNVHSLVDDGTCEYLLPFSTFLDLDGNGLVDAVQESGSTVVVNLDVIGGGSDAVHVAGASSIVIGDLNGDGLPDLISSGFDRASGWRTGTFVTGVR